MILVMLCLVLTIVWGTGGYLYVILLFEGMGGGGGEVLCPSFEQKDDTKIASSAGGYIRIARQWRFLVIMVRTWMPFYNVGKNVIGIKSNPTSFNSNQLLQLLGNDLTKNLSHF